MRANRGNRSAFSNRGKVGEEKIEDEDWQVGQVGLEEE